MPAKAGQLRPVLFLFLIGSFFVLKTWSGADILLYFTLLSGLSSIPLWLECLTANPLAFKDVGSNPTPETQLIRAHGTLNGGGLYPVFYAGASERPWTSLNE